VAGVAGGAFYLAWTIRVANRPQMIVNAVAICIGVAGLINFETPQEPPRQSGIDRQIECERLLGIGND